MEDRNVKWRVGVVAVATFVITALLIAVSTSVDLPFGVGQYEIQIKVDRAPGVGRNTPVRRDGVLIGRVERTEPVEGGRLITAHVNQSEPILKSDIIEIRPSSLFGDAVIDFVQTGGDQTKIDPGATLNGSALPDPIKALTDLQVRVSPAVESLGNAGDAVAELATRINRIIGDEADGQRLSDLLDKGIVAMDEFSVTMKQMSDVATAIDSVIGEQEVQQDLKQALADAPKFMSEIRTVAQQATETIQSLDSAITSAERNLKNIEGLTEPIGERGPELAQSVISALENLDIALADISRFAKTLNDSQGAVGKLVNDPELYDNFNTTICNANLVISKVYRLLDKLSPQLQAIVNDVRVATDKVGREPGRVVGGAFNKGPGVK